MYIYTYIHLYPYSCIHTILLSLSGGPVGPEAGPSTGAGATVSLETLKVYKNIFAICIRIYMNTRTYTCFCIYRYLHIYMYLYGYIYFFFYIYIYIYKFMYTLTVSLETLKVYKNIFVHMFCVLNIGLRVKKVFLYCSKILIVFPPYFYQQ
jgi:hypothetical protein